MSPSIPLGCTIVSIRLETARFHASRRGTAMLKIVIRLLGIHLTNSHAQTAPGSAHALDLAGLKSPEICFWSAWDGDDLLAVGAMKRLSHSHGEVKSMHTAEAVRRRGVGSAMLEHIIDVARNRGIKKLS